MAAKRKRVLVVDDYRDAAQASCMLLELLGHEARVAYNGRDALAEASAFDPEIVLLDLGLPDVSGYEVARELRRRARGKRLHLTAVTGWGDADERARTQAAGFDQHVMKPTDATKLEAILKRAGAR
jgi:DNA-binding response OmpR family regulator